MEFIEYLQKLRSHFLHDHWKETVFQGGKGIWGRAKEALLLKVFQALPLTRYHHFVDLGSGDGSIVFLASQFIAATGIEASEEFYRISIDLSKQLQQEHLLPYPCHFLHHNFLTADLSWYDFFFINPDQSLDHLVRKLKHEAKGKCLLVYNSIFLPQGLRFLRRYWFDLCACHTL